jgi:subtilisin-like proprotein convertase family protein
MMETIVVGDINRGGVAENSPHCAALLASAPSGYMTTFDTQCSAKSLTDLAPSSMATGVAALILQANPHLMWYDVQDIIVRTVRRIHTAEEDWVINQAGMRYHPRYGFGLIDASAAVKMAKSYHPRLSRAVITKSMMFDPVHPIPDCRPQTPVLMTFDIGSKDPVQHVQVLYHAQHTHSRDLSITLTSPFGTEVTLAEHEEACDVDVQSRVRVVVATANTSGASTYRFAQCREELTLPPEHIVMFTTSCCSLVACQVSHAHMIGPDKVLVFINAATECGMEVQTSILKQRFTTNEKGLILGTIVFVVHDLSTPLPVDPSVVIVGITSFPHTRLTRLSMTLVHIPEKKTVRSFAPWLFMSTAFWGENPHGQWVVSTRDHVCNDVGAISNISLSVWVPEIPTPTPSPTPFAPTPTPLPPCLSSCPECREYADPVQCEQCNVHICQKYNCSRQGCNVCNSCCNVASYLCSQCVEMNCGTIPSCNPDIGCNVCGECCTSELHPQSFCQSCMENVCNATLIGPEMSQVLAKAGKILASIVGLSFVVFALVFLFVKLWRRFYRPTKSKSSKKSKKSKKSKRKNVDEFEDVVLVDDEDL